MQTRLFLSFAVLAAAFALTGCKTNQATGRYQLDIYSKAAEVQLGEEVASQIEASMGPLTSDRALADYVTDIGNRVADEAEPFYQDIPWEFNVVDDPTVNAFALPGGKLYIHRGLLEIMDNEAQLAGVLAHEVGHVTAEHHDRMAGRSIAIALGVTLAQVLAENTENELVEMGVPVFVTGTGLLNLKYSRDQEYESDDLGVRYMAKAGYDPRELAEVMRRIDQASSGQRPSEWLSTHPNPPNRVDAILRYVDDTYPDLAGMNAVETNAAAYRRNVLDRIR